MKNTFYITTPIYYPNAKPHIGTIYSTVLADIIARYQKFLKKEVFFLTGLDEHGQKVADTALKENISAQQFVDDLAIIYIDVFKKWEIQYNFFMRTTFDLHKNTISDWIVKLQNAGYIYKSNYSGWYSVSSEEFLTEKDIELKNEDGVPLCPITKKPAVWITEDAYFFRLSSFEGRLIDFFEQNPSFIIPKERMSEVTAFIKGGLRDLCISRLKKNLSWGIPFPNDNEHIVYVWADALNNYITGVGYLHNNVLFEKWWPCNVHIMAKDIIRFHAIYWIAFLMASDLPLPKNELVHGWLLVDNKKMSKSLGNVIDPEILIKKYPVDSIRYYFSTLSMKEDSNFNIDDLVQRHNSDLCDNLSNLLQRTIVLCAKKNISTLYYDEKLINQSDLYIINEGKQLISDVVRELYTYQILKINNLIMTYIKNLNAYFHKQSPWKEDSIERFSMIVANILNGLWKVGVLLAPIMPTKMKELLHVIGIDGAQENISTITHSSRTFVITMAKDYIFKKIECFFDKDNLKKNKQEDKKDDVERTKYNYVSFDEFMKNIILVGQIEKVNDIEKSDKLYYLTVNFGDNFGIKKIASGIKEYFEKSQLINQKTIFSFNLAPRTLRGVISEGMILMTENNEGVPTIISIGESIKIGTRIK